MAAVTIWKQLTGSLITTLHPPPGSGVWGCGGVAVVCVSPGPPRARSNEIPDLYRNRPPLPPAPAGPGSLRAWQPGASGAKPRPSGCPEGCLGQERWGWRDLDEEEGLSGWPSGQRGCGQNWGRQVGECPRHRQRVGLPQGLVGRGEAASGFTQHPLTSGRPRGEQEPRPGDLHCLGKVPLEGTWSHRCPASWRNC